MASRDRLSLNKPVSFKLSAKPRLTKRLSCQGYVEQQKRIEDWLECSSDGRDSLMQSPIRPRQSIIQVLDEKSKTESFVRRRVRFSDVRFSLIAARNKDSASTSSHEHESDSSECPATPPPPPPQLEPQRVAPVLPPVILEEPSDRLRSPSNADSDSDGGPFSSPYKGSATVGWCHSGRSPKHPKKRRGHISSKCVGRISKVEEIRLKPNGITISVVSESLKCTLQVEHFTLWNLPNGPEEVMKYIDRNPIKSKSIKTTMPAFVDAINDYIKLKYPDNFDHQQA